MNLNDQEKNISPASKKIPKWLEGAPILPGRAETELDAIEAAAKEGEGEVLIYDVAKHRPPHKWKTMKRVQRRIAEMEELHEFGEKKDGPEVDNFLDGLEKAANSMSS